MLNQDHVASMAMQNIRTSRVAIDISHVTSVRRYGLARSVVPGLHFDLRLLLLALLSLPSRCCPSPFDPSVAISRLAPIHGSFVLLSRQSWFRVLSSLIS